MKSLHMGAFSALRLFGRTTLDCVSGRPALHSHNHAAERARLLATQCWSAQGSDSSKHFLENKLVLNTFQLKRRLTRSAKHTTTEDGYVTLGAGNVFQDAVGERDKLYKMIELELRGHEVAVLDSYQWFLTRAAEELGIKVSRVYTPLRNDNRFSLLKSAFIYKKHMVQYEIRTYLRVIQMKRLTGSTADTYLEYVERNLPEGVAMKVLACEVEGLPVDVFAKQTKDTNSTEQLEDDAQKGER